MSNLKYSNQRSSRIPWGFISLRVPKNPWDPKGYEIPWDPRRNKTPWDPKGYETP